MAPILRPQPLWALFIRRYPHTEGATTGFRPNPQGVSRFVENDHIAQLGEPTSVPSAAVSDGPAYIAFEGAEGCGKSTQAARLADAIGATLTRETGGTDIGRRIRDILHDTTVDNLVARAEALLTAADRAQHLAEIVAPALAAGRSVVSDRSVYSSLAYQGYGRQLDIDEIRHLNEWGTEGLWPTTVVFLDTPDETIAERMSRRDLDRFEAAGDEFHARVLGGFRAMAAAEPDRWITVRAVGSVDRVAEEIRGALVQRGAL